MPRYVSNLEWVIRGHQQGVNHICGCRTSRLYALAERALPAGKLPVETLYHRPSHGAGLAEPVVQAG